MIMVRIYVTWVQVTLKLLRKIIMLKLIKIVLLTSVFLSGCANVKLTDESKASINTFSIDEEIVIPQGAYYNGPEGALTGLGGLIGLVSGLDGLDAQATNSELISALVETNAAADKHYRKYW
jgi:hypothetical protein